MRVRPAGAHCAAPGRGTATSRAPDTPRRTALWQVLALCLCMLVSCAAPGAADDLDAVMQLLAKRRHGAVSFVEQHFLALLKRPAESSGELLYDAPDRLEKRTLEPHRERLLLEGNVLTVERAGRNHVLDTQSYPEALPFIDSIRSTLAGDRPGLEKMFRLDFSGSLARWTLVLVPLDARAAKTVAEVQIDGSRDDLLRVEIRQPDGDRSLMTLRPHTSQ